jgi:hypothetical protein
MMFIVIGMATTAIGSLLDTSNQLKMPLLILAVVIVMIGFVISVLNLKKGMVPKR